MKGLTTIKGLKENIIHALDEGVRFDGRATDTYREVSIETGISKNAEGSVRVRMGKTEVYAGVKFEVGTPYSDAPDKGSLMVNAELLPLSSPMFEPGPPGMPAIELARITDRAIREAPALDVKDLCITEGEKVWTVIVDLISINHDGNLYDACALAAMAALQDARFPAYDEETGVVDYKTKTDRKLKILNKPLSITLHKVGNHILVDPTVEEESAADARLTIGVMDAKTLCSLQKGGDHPLTAEDVDKMAKLALKKGEELRKKL